MSLQRKIGVVFMVFGGVIAAGTWAATPNDARNSVPLNLLGLVNDHAEQAEPIAAMQPEFMVVGADPEANRAKRVVLWDATLKVLGKHTPNYPQQVGDCTAFGAKNAVEYLQCWEILSERQDAFHPVFPPYYYGYSRHDVGEDKISGDGSVGAWTAVAVSEGGTLPSDVENCPEYSGKIAKEWGRKGPPQWAREIAAEHRVKTISRVKTAQDVCDAICNGYPVTIASSFGTTQIKPKDGRNVARWNSSWQHQMAIVGYDGTVGESAKYFYVLNSWGEKAHPAPLNNEPPGGFWITWNDCEKIVKQGDSWAFSSFEGFPSTELDFSVFGSASVGAVPHDQGGSSMLSQIEIDSSVGYAVGLAFLVAGFVVFWLGNRKGRAGLIAATALAGVAMFTTNAAAEDVIDFDVIGNVRAIKETAEPTTESSGNNALDWNVIGDVQRAVEAERLLDWNVIGSVANAVEKRHECGCGDDCGCGDECKCDGKKFTRTTPSSHKNDLSALIPQPSYPVRPQSTWWGHHGVTTREQLIDHLMTGQHANKFDRQWLQSLTVAQLESLHSDDHDHKLKAHVQKQSARKSKIPIYGVQKVCENGVCRYERVIVGYRWE